MTQATLFIQYESPNPANPIAAVIAQIAKGCGAVIRDKLIDDTDIETDLAFVNSAETALRFIKETEHTVIFLSYFNKNEETESHALASRFPTRIKAMPIVERTGEENILIPLILAIAEINKEKNQ